jgi:hypothetical protein
MQIEKLDERYSKAYENCKGNDREASRRSKFENFVSRACDEALCESNHKICLVFLQLNTEVCHISLGNRKNSNTEQS